MRKVSPVFFQKGVLIFIRFFCHSIRGWIYLSGLFEVQVTEVGLSIRGLLICVKDGSEEDPGTEGSRVKDVSLLLSSFPASILRQGLLVEWTLAPPDLYPTSLTVPVEKNKDYFPKKFSTILGKLGSSIHLNLWLRLGMVRGRGRLAWARLCNGVHWRRLSPIYFLSL